MGQHQLTRAATFDRASADRVSRTVRASLSSESPVFQNGVPEVLRHDAASVDLTRAVNGLPLLVSHDRSSLPVGIVEDVHVANRRLVGMLRFGSSSRAQEIFADVADGVLRSISISYAIERAEVSPEGGYIAVRWAPLEVSLVSVAADHSVGVGRSAAEQPSSTGTTTMTTETTTPTAAGERQRAADIADLCSRHAVPVERMSRYISEGTTVEAVRTAILADLVRQDEATGMRRNVVSSAWHLGGDRGEQSRALMEQAVAARYGGARASAGNPYVHQRLVDLARERCEVFGTHTTALHSSAIFDRAFSTSDFPNVLANAFNKVLAGRYLSFPGGLKRAARSTTIRDFRAKLQLRLGETPALLKVNELGEYKQGGMLDARESYAISTFGRIVTVSRQALINDDLSAFETLGLRFAQQAAELEASMLATLLTSNPVMSEDSTVLFHTNHNNIATGAGSVLSLTSLSTARKSMRLQKGLDAVTPIDASPKFLIVPASLETLAEQLLTQTTPAQADQVNPFNAPGKLELIVEPRLDAVSATAWYLSSDPALLDTLEYAYLEGEAGPQVFVEQLFEQDGMSMKCRLDFGCGVLDFRGLFKSAGA
jgi:hypothetical protein